MFSSENNSYYPLFYNPSPFFTNTNPESNINGILLPSPSTFSPIPENPMPKLPSHPSSSKRESSKKERHTKIATAQGVRDRRVRLSMTVAQDFFNLQDLLGFDKASTTLGWLMSKSKAAIDQVTINYNLNKLNKEDVVTKKRNCVTKTFGNKNRREKEVNNGGIVSMETIKRREEARKRARERTRNKNNNKQALQLHSSVHQQEWMVQQEATCSSDYYYQQGWNYNNNDDYLNNSTMETCNHGGFPTLTDIDQSTGLEFWISGTTWDAYNDQLLH